MQNSAVIFDFDDTLMPDSTSELLKEHGIDADEFWGKTVKDLLFQGYEPALAYLNRILENVGEKKPLGLMTNAGLSEFGKSLSGRFYPGVSGLFKELKENALAVSNDINLEF